MREQVLSWLREGDSCSMISGGNGLGCEIAHGTLTVGPLRPMTGSYCRWLSALQRAWCRLGITLPLLHGQALHFTGKKKQDPRSKAACLNHSAGPVTSLPHRPSAYQTFRLGHEGCHRFNICVPPKFIY